MKTCLKIYLPERSASLRVTPHGVIRKRSQSERLWEIPERKKRGKITVFSRDSARRLRESLIKIPNDVGIYGVTLTFKESAWKNVMNEDAQQMRDLFKSLTNKLRHASKQGDISKLFYMFWRIELQKNRTPHFHLVVSTDNVRDILYLREVFFRTVYTRLGYGCPDNAFDMRELSGYSQAFAYICSHTSKHKREQLGWIGKQWGLVFPSKEAKEFYKNGATNEIISEHNASYELSIDEEVAINRIIRRMYFARLRCDYRFLNSDGKIRRCSIGKLSKRLSSVGCQFTTLDTSSKLIKWINLKHEREISEYSLSVEKL